MAGDIRSKTRDDAGRLLPGIHIGFALVTMAGFQVTLYCRVWVPLKEFDLICRFRRMPGRLWVTAQAAIPCTTNAELGRQSQRPYFQGVEFGKKVEATASIFPRQTVRFRLG